MDMDVWPRCSERHRIVLEVAGSNFSRPIFFLIDTRPPRFDYGYIYILQIDPTWDRWLTKISVNVTESYMTGPLLNCSAP